MNLNLYGELVNAMLMGMGGIWVTLTGFRIIGKRPGESLDYDRWHEQFGRLFRLTGPGMVLVSLFLAGRAILSN